MTGHIKLGAIGALRDYYLKGVGDDGVAWSRGPANPFAANVNTSNPYDRVDDWNEWVQNDWQLGVGRVNPEEGGFLYAEAETRVPNQVILPPLLQFTDLREVTGVSADCRYVPDDTTTTVTLDAAGAVRRVATPFTTPASLPDPVMTIRVYLQIASGDTITLKIYSNSAGSPNAVVATASNTISESVPTPQFKWYVATCDTTAMAGATAYWLSIECSGAGTLVGAGSAGYSTASRGYNGSAWSAIASTFILYDLNVNRPTHASGNLEGLFRFNGETYLYGEEELSKYVPADNNWATVGTITGAGNVTSAVVFGPEVHFGRSSGNYTTMDTSEAFTAEGVTRKLFLNYKGLLYGTWQNDLYYSDDGSTWSSAFAVGGDDVEIRGLAGMGDSVYLATDKALMRFAPGNVVEEITRFGVEDDTNGVNMVAYNGALYIPMQGRLFRFDQSGQLQDIWITGENDLALDKIGAPTCLALMNNWLVARVTSPSALGRISLWIWQEEGWHFLADTGQHVEAPGTLLQPNTLVLYDRENSCLFVVVYGFQIGKLEIDDYTLNPYNSSTYLYMPYGWLEQDRFYGGLYLIDKAFYSVTLAGDNLSSGVKANVYWQDEGSAGLWELLGTVDSDGEELIWPVASRPLGRWVKLAVRLQTNDGSETPRLRAIIVKFLPVINDRRQDQITVVLESNQQGPDDTPDAYTLAQQKTHLESLIGFDGASSNFLFLYQDIFGVQFEVTVADHSWSAPVLAWENGAQVVKSVECTLVLKQLPDTLYSA